MQITYPTHPTPSFPPVSLVSACPVTYVFPYLLSTVISICTNVPVLPTLLLHRAAPEMRGRVMGIRGLAIIPLFGGNLVGGALTGWLGAPTALAIFGAAGILSVLAIGLRLPALRR